MQEIGVGKIASISGRYYAMDRDNNWDRIQKAYDSLVSGTGVQATDAVKAMETSYADGVTDEFVLPTFKSGKCIVTECYGDLTGTIRSEVEENNGIIFFYNRNRCTGNGCSESNGNFLCRRCDR